MPPITCDMGAETCVLRPSSDLKSLLRPGELPHFLRTQTNTYCKLKFHRFFGRPTAAPGNYIDRFDRVNELACCISEPRAGLPLLEGQLCCVPQCASEVRRVYGEISCPLPFPRFHRVAPTV